MKIGIEAYLFKITLSIFSLIDFFLDLVMTESLIDSINLYL